MRLLIPLITFANRVQRAWDRRSPAARQRAIERTVRAFERIPPLEGDTAYQRNASNPTRQQLPQTVSTLEGK